ncbi:MAG TPA: CAP domain-containing protein [Bryobacteraceae bacterium]|nr:CAP domain-containing protein [Bryobacteraceae bacterium]
MKTPVFYCFSVFSALIIGSALSPTAVAASGALDSEEAALLDLINNYRAQNGAAPLQASATLQPASEWMSNDLATVNHAFSHTDSLGRDPVTRVKAFGYSYPYVGENIAAGNADAQNTFAQWQSACDPDSSGACTYAHRQNMLNAGFHAIGIGRAYGANSAYGWYWVTDFGGTLDQPLGGGGGPTSPSAPRISSFAAMPLTISSGQSSTLTWSISGSPTSVTIDNGVGSVSGVSSKSVSPAQTTTYTITASNSAGAATAHVVVTVTAAYDTQPPTTPVLISAQAMSAVDVDLTWSASSDNMGVAGYQILRNGAAIGTVGASVLLWSDTSVSGGASYNYTVRAFDGAGNFSGMSNSIVVSTPAAADRSRSAPVISAFTASPATISAGQTSVLTWLVSEASTIRISGYPSSVAGMTSLAVTPSQTTTYTLTATNAAGSASASVTVTVGGGATRGSGMPPTTPVLKSAVARSSGEVDLTWAPSTSSAGVRGYQIFRNGSVIATTAGSYVAWSDNTVSANTVYTYAIRAVDAGGTNSAMSNSIQVITPGAADRQSR